MSDSYSPQNFGEGEYGWVDEEEWAGAPEVWTRCTACYGTGIDPRSDDDMTGAEWDCMDCNGYGEIPFIES